MILIKFILSLHSGKHKTQQNSTNNMKEKLQFEMFILLCLYITGVLCEKLIKTGFQSTIAFYGSIVGIGISLFICAVFITMSISGIPNHSRIRKKTKRFYEILAIIALFSLLIFFIFEVKGIIALSIVCLLWYLANVIRIIMFWDWI